MSRSILSRTIGELSASHPAMADFFIGVSGQTPKPDGSVLSWLAGVGEDRLSQWGMDRDQALAHIEALAGQIDALRSSAPPEVRALTILGGINKQGQPEDLRLTLRPGELVSVVGPTGSGKSRLLGDIECLAQGDTPSGRRILVNDAPPAPGLRFSTHQKLVAQLSQTMNFVMDLSVGDFIAMHAECRMSGDVGSLVSQVIARANELAGEPFGRDAALTQLSGGQTRALMIADTALLSASPIVLIDEIENAGIDRKKSLELLLAREKIVLMSTHDPILALLGDRRLVIRSGAVVDIIETSEAERANLTALEQLDQTLMAVRHQLRSGLRIDSPVEEMLPWMR
ncbi:MAG: ATP-binding cassette domain-containing protein [Magnetospirillum sp.]